MNRCAFALLVSAALVVFFAASGSAQTALEGRPWELDPNTLRVDTQTYQVVFNGTGNVWGLGFESAFNFQEALTVGPFGLPTKRLGGFFEVCLLIDCLDFGAAVDYGLNMGGGLKLEAVATTGTLTVRYPMTVIVRYPSFKGLRPGDKVSIGTSYVPDRTAQMHSGDPRFRAEVSARADMEAGIGAQAKAFSIPYPPTPYPGFIRVHDNYSLFNTDAFTSADWTHFTIGPADVWAKVPLLGTDGLLGHPSNQNWLSSYRVDGFLNAGVNITNLVSQAVLGVKLTDKQSFGPFNLEYSLLGLTPRLGAAAEQELIFEVRPRITFAIENLGNVSHVSINAGESFDLTLPDDGSVYTITPTINPRGHAVRNTTALFATADALVDPLRVKAGLNVRFGPIKINPELSFNPFNGPKSVPVSEQLHLVGFDRWFELTTVEAPEVVGYPYTLSPDATTPHLVAVCASLASLGAPGRDCRNWLFPQTTDAVVFAKADLGYDANTEVRVNGQVVEYSPYGAGSCAAAGGASLAFGQLCLTIPGHLLAQPGTLRVQLVRSVLGLPPRPKDFSNTVDFQVFSPELTLASFNTSIAGQIPNDEPCPGDDCQINFFGNLFAGAGPIKVFLTTRDLVSRHLPLEFITPQSTLVWDDVPIATTIKRQTTLTHEGTTPVYTTTYDVSATVPSGLQTGGVHKLSFVNSGINAPETVLEPITVYNLAPTITTLLRTGTSREGIRLAINGTDFAPDSTAEWDGTPVATTFVSPNLVVITISARDLAPGDHNVIVNNPAFGGPSNTAVYKVPTPATASLAVDHSLFRNSKGEIGDVVTFTNTGTGTLNLQITSIKLHVGRGGYSVNRKIPETIPSIDVGGANSLIGYFPAVGTPGQAAEIRIRARLDGKEIHIDLPVTLPQ